MKIREINSEDLSLLAGFLKNLEVAEWAMQLSIQERAAIAFPC
jgi:hypothetical protein